jgi:hypothetical protein
MGTRPSSPTVQEPWEHLLSVDVDAVFGAEEVAGVRTQFKLLANAGMVRDAWACQ